jgi:hypothetical protein
LNGSNHDGGGPRVLAIADFDQDGAPDIASAHYDIPLISVSRNGGDGGFDPPVDFPATSADAWTLFAGDVSGDGRADLVVGAQQGGAVLLTNTCPAPPRHCVARHNLCDGGLPCCNTLGCHAGLCP